jgi:hypothetical protein
MAASLKNTDWDLFTFQVFVQKWIVYFVLIEKWSESAETRLVIVNTVHVDVVVA